LAVKVLKFDTEDKQVLCQKTRIRDRFLRTPRIKKDLYIKKAGGNSKWSLGLARNMEKYKNFFIILAFFKKIMHVSGEKGKEHQSIQQVLIFLKKKRYGTDQF